MAGGPSARGQRESWATWPRPVEPEPRTGAPHLAGPSGLRAARRWGIDGRDAVLCAVRGGGRRSLAAAIAQAAVACASARRPCTRCRGCELGALLPVPGSCSALGVVWAVGRSTTRGAPERGDWRGRGETRVRPVGGRPTVRPAFGSRRASPGSIPLSIRDDEEEGEEMDDELREVAAHFDSGSARDAIAQALARVAPPWHPNALRRRDDDISALH